MRLVVRSAAAAPAGPLPATPLPQSPSQLPGSASQPRSAPRQSAGPQCELATPESSQERDLGEQLLRELDTLLVPLDTLVLKCNNLLLEVSTGLSLVLKVEGEDIPHRCGVHQHN
jgi:hypothetical protein